MEEAIEGRDKEYDDDDEEATVVSEDDEEEGADVAEEEEDGTPSFPSPARSLRSLIASATLSSKVSVPCMYCDSCAALRNPTVTCAALFSMSRRFPRSRSGP